MVIGTQTMYFSLILLATFCVAEDYVEKPIQYQSIGDGGTYEFGYDTGLVGAHSLRRETKDENGIIRGKYAYTDPNGSLRSVVYEAGPFGFRAKGDVGPDGFPQSEVPAPIIFMPGYSNNTAILSPEASNSHYVADASSHPNRESKGYVYDSASHDVSSHPTVPPLNFVYEVPYIPKRPSPPVAPPVIRVPAETVHPNSRSKGYVQHRPSPSIPRPVIPDRPSPPVVLRPVVHVPAESVHPNSRSKGYVHDSSSHDVSSRQTVAPLVHVHAESSHPNSRSKGYVHDSSSHRTVRPVVHVPPVTARPVVHVTARPVVHVHETRPVARPIVHVPAESSHPNSRSKGYVHDSAHHDVSAHPTVRPLHFVYEASSHPNSRSKGYVHAASTHPSGPPSAHVHRNTHAHDHKHDSSSHPNSHSKAYVHNPHSHVHNKPYVASQSAPIPPPSSNTVKIVKPAPPPARSGVISVSRTSSVSVSSSAGRIRSAARPISKSTYTKGYATGPRAQATLARPVSRPRYSKGYVTGSHSRDTIVRAASRPSYSKAYVGGRYSSSNRVVSVASRKTPEYMSAEEYIGRYRS